MLFVSSYVSLPLGSNAKVQVLRVQKAQSLAEVVDVAKPAKIMDPLLVEIIQIASQALINNMTLNSGWHHSPPGPQLHARVLWSDKISECFNQACVRMGFKSKF